MNGRTKGIKKMRNENASIYMCVNLTNGKIYIGSASKGYLYDRYRAHLFLAKKQGSKIVCACADAPSIGLRPARLIVILIMITDFSVMYLVLVLFLVLLV